MGGGTADVESIFKDFNKREHDIVFLAYHPSHINSTKSGAVTLADCLGNMKENCRCLVWMDVVDGTGGTQFEVLPYVDKYFKKQLLSDYSLYAKPVYNKRIYCDYYHNEFGISDDEPQSSGELLPAEYVDKLGVSWNIGLGDQFTRGKVQKLFDFKSTPSIPWMEYDRTRIFDVHYRGSAWPGTAGEQRRLTTKGLLNNTTVSKPDPTTKVSQKDYYKEMLQSYAVISPFGWGEICTRDFEAFAYSLALIKPDVSHMKTYPNWFEANKTYIPIKWDYSNFDSILDLFSTEEGRQKVKDIAIQGQECYRSLALANKKARNDFVEHIMDELGID